MNKTYDVIIVGAGPAGSSAAITLAEKEYNVLIIDKANFPREKVCGDGLTESSIKLLNNLGIKDEINSQGYISNQIQFYPFKTKSFLLNNRVITIKRKNLDNILLQNAINKGVEFKHAKYIKHTEKTNKYNEVIAEFPTNKRKIKLYSRIVILATGAHIPDYVKNRVNNKKVKRSTYIAVRGYFKKNLGINTSSVFFKKALKNGYFWIFPMGNDLYNIGCGTKAYKNVNLKSKLNNFLYEEFSIEDPHHCWINSPTGELLVTSLANSSLAVNGNTILAGETLGTTYPFTGEGIRNALQTGILSGKIIDEALRTNNFSILNKYYNIINNTFINSQKPYLLAEKLLTNKISGSILFYLLYKSPYLRGRVSKIMDKDLSKY